MIKYGELEHEKNLMFENIEKWSQQRNININIIPRELIEHYYNEHYYNKQLEAFKKQVEIEKSMLLNGMINGQEKEIVKYNISQIVVYDIIPFEFHFAWKYDCFDPPLSTYTVE